MDKVYVLVEERENSVECQIHGIWSSRERACDEMLRIINKNVLFTEKSKIDILEGIAESDPDYCEEKYCNYSVDEHVVL